MPCTKKLRIQTEIFKRPHFWMKILELIFCSISFGITTYYEPELLVQPHNLSPESRTSYVQSHIISVATCGYTFVVVIITIIGYLVEGIVLDYNVMCGLFNCVGFIVYVVSASIVVSKLNDDFDDNDYEATGVSAMCFLTAFFFLIDSVVFWVYYFKKRPSHLSAMKPTNHINN